MRRIGPAAIVLALLILAACSQEAPAAENNLSLDDLQTASGAATASGAKLRPAANVFYRDLGTDDVPAGKPAVLFFWQPGDPFSRRSDKLLTQLYGSGTANISTYRLDAGTASGMKLKYTVLLPDTFVLLNASGGVLSSIIHPNTGELRSLVIR